MPRSFVEILHCLFTLQLSELPPSNTPSDAALCSPGYSGREEGAERECPHSARRHSYVGIVFRGISPTAAAFTSWPSIDEPAISNRWLATSPAPRQLPQSRDLPILSSVSISCDVYYQLNRLILHSETLLVGSWLVIFVPLTAAVVQAGTNPE